MSDDDPVIVCCILGLCCPAGSPQQLAQVKAVIHHRRPSWSKNRVADVAERLLAYYANFEHVGELLKDEGEKA